MTRTGLMTATAAAIAGVAAVEGASALPETASEAFEEIAVIRLAPDAPSVDYIGALGLDGEFAPRASELELDVGLALGATGLVAEPDNVEGSLGRVLLRFEDVREPERPYDLRDPSFDPLQTLAPVDQRTPLAGGDVGALSAAAPAAPGVGGFALRYDLGDGAVGAIGGFDVQVSPSASFTVRDAVSSAGAGAIVRFGRNLTEPRGEDQGGWYIFAGADARALTWKLDDAFALDDAVRLEERTIVGDAQAGVAFRVGRADVALAIVHREVHYRDTSADEQFAGISIAFRH